MAKFESSTLTWISQRNAENWVIDNSELIEKLKESSVTRVEVFKFFRSQGYDTDQRIRRVLKSGEEYGILRRTRFARAQIEVTDLGLELYKMMLQGGKITHPLVTFKR